MTKELVIISGKGGTGKTSIVSAISTLAKNRIIVDCDVDASDLHLIMKPQIINSNEFYCGKTAIIDETKCIKCGKCKEICRFNAIINNKIDAIKCEGCASCFYKCPVNAIRLEDSKSGDWFESNTRFGKLIHAKLGVGEENSGKLVTQIRNHARNVAKETNVELIIVDGSPGIGCPVIASISGANLVIIVTEPTCSGLHDAKRVYELTKHFHTNSVICINKFDINIEMTNKIETFAKENNIKVIEKIPYSKEFTKAMIEEKSIIEYSKDSEISQKIINMWNYIEELLNGK